MSNEDLDIKPTPNGMRCDYGPLSYFPCNRCCGTNKHGFTEQDILVTSMNTIGSALHYTLAMGIPLALSFWRVHDDYKDDGSLIFPQILGFLSLFLWYLTIGKIYSDLYVIQHNRNPGISKDGPPQKLKKPLSQRRPMLMGIYLIVVGILGAASAALIIPKISGTFPFLVTLSPNKQDNIAPPFDDPVCDGVNYATASDKTIFDWTACVRDNPVYRDRHIYDEKTGSAIPWVNDLGQNCAAAACSDVVSNIYSSNEACSKCLNGKGGQECKGRRCQISDNPGNFVQLGGRGDDPGNFVTIGKAEILIPYDIDIAINMTGLHVFNKTSSSWESTAPVKGDTIRFYRDGAEGKGGKEEGIYAGDKKATVQFNWYTWWFLYAFCIITCGFHTTLFWSGLNEIICDETKPCKDKPRKRPTCCPLGLQGIPCAEPGYIFELRNGIQIYRWIEYCITASIMFIIVLQLNRVSDLWILITAYLMSAGYNIFGSAIDITENWVFVAAFWEISFVMFVAQFAVLYYNQQYTIQPFLDEDLPSRDLWAQLFAFVQAVNWGIFITYLTFPTVNLIHQWHRLKCCGREKLAVCCGDKIRNGETQEKFETRTKRNNMFRAEVAYIWLSFIAKAQMVFFVFWGVAARTN